MKDLAHVVVVVVVLDLYVWCHAVTLSLPCEIRREREPFLEGEVRVLVLVPWLDERFSGAGYALMAAGRVAQKEVNEDNSLLPNYTVRLIEGYETCGPADTFTCGLNNLVQYTIDPAYALAVAGIYCSISTVTMSALAGREEINLIQLAASISPVFESGKNSLGRFPHLWRFLKSASIYADLILDLMDMFDWSNITLVQDYDSFYHSIIAELLSQKINKTTDKQILYITSALNNMQQIDESLRNIHNMPTRIIVAIASSSQLAKVLCMAEKYKMYYPEYLWIVNDCLPQHLERENHCSKEQLHRILNGSVMTYYNLHSERNSTILVSGQPYSTYLERYQEELESLKAEFGDSSISGDPPYGGLLYDQIWALALGLNSSLLEINDNNISLSYPGLNRLKITQITEKAFTKLDFQGVTNRIKFSEQRDIPTSINLYQVLEQEAMLVGSYYYNKDTQNYELNVSLDGFNDKIEIRDRVIVLPLVVIMFIISGLVTVMVSVMMGLLLYYRHSPVIKATSPVLSLLIYVGCYFLCLASFGRILLANITHEVFYTVNCNMQVVLIANGFNFIFLTLLAKILRIYFIFKNVRMQRMGREWNNSVLAMAVCVISLASNAIFIAWFAFDHLRQEKVEEFIVNDNDRYIAAYSKCVSKYSTIWYLIFVAYHAVVLFLVVLVAFWSRRIRYQNFKDTKRANLFVFVIVIWYIAFVSGWWVTRELNLVDIANLFVYAIFILTVISCQVFLFLPRFKMLIISSVKQKTPYRSMYHSCISCIMHRYSS